MSRLALPLLLMLAGSAAAQQSPDERQWQTISSRLDAVAGALKARGHRVKLIGRQSGLQGILATPGGLQGGADSRREGVAIGD